MQELEITVMVDADGNWVACRLDQDVAEAWDNAIGDVPAFPTATYTLKLKVPTPKPSILTATLPEVNHDAELTVSAQ